MSTSFSYQIIPEIDAPAHVGNGWDWGPKFGMGELGLCINRQPWSFYCGKILKRIYDGQTNESREKILK